MNRLLRVALTAALLITIGCCPPAAATTSAAPITFAYAGDSITARADSWLTVMRTDSRFASVGGYAQSGYRSDQVLAQIKAVPTADVLVIELGTNDVNQQIPADTIIANLQAIIGKVDAHRTLITALPPSDITGGGGWGTNRNQAAILFNRQLAIWAGYHGYVYFDPYIVDREADGTWTAGTDVDGVHPTATANETIEKWFGWGIQQADAASRG